MKRRGRIEHGVFAAVMMIIGACASSEPGPEARAAANPFAAAKEIEAGESEFAGRVAERIEAGSYVYLRVERPGGDGAWVASLKNTASSAERVHVRVLKKSDTFHSKRLGRTFSPLHFAIVRKDTP